MCSREYLLRQVFWECKEMQKRSQLCDCTLYEIRLSVCVLITVRGYQIVIFHFFLHLNGSPTGRHNTPGASDFWVVIEEILHVTIDLLHDIFTSLSTSLWTYNVRWLFWWHLWPVISLFLMWLCSFCHQINTVENCCCPSLFVKAFCKAKMTPKGAKGYYRPPQTLPIMLLRAWRGVLSASAVWLHCCSMAFCCWLSASYSAGCFVFTSFQIG